MKRFLNSFGFRVACSIFWFVITHPLRSIFGTSLTRHRCSQSSRLNQILDSIRRGPIAHRGGVPENTTVAFREAKAAGATTVEVDLQFSKDGYPVLFHDETVDRVSNGSGYLQQMTLEEIKSLDVGTKYGYEGTSVPTLLEAVETLNELDMYMFLEIKNCHQKSFSAVLRLFQENPLLYSKIIIISFLPDVLYTVRVLDPEILIGLTIEHDILKSDHSKVFRFESRWKSKLVDAVQSVMNWFLVKYIWKALGVGLVLPCKHDILEKRFNVDYFHSQGVKLVTWTVNSKDEKEHFDQILKLPYMTDHIH